VTYEGRTAWVHVDERGDWILTITGTGIRHRLWNDEAVPLDCFPAKAMCAHLVRLGWTPDVWGAWNPNIPSAVGRLALAQMGGWRKAGELTWTIPCYREESDTLGVP
jgi:hypothetical protein